MMAANGTEGNWTAPELRHSSSASFAAPAPDSLFALSLRWLSSAQFAQVQEMISWLLNGPLTLVFVLSGIVLNALCVLVFLRFRNASGTTPIIHYYLISLAGWHSALLCNAFVLYCLPTLLWGSVISAGPYVHLYPPTYTLANATHTGTVWIILALTLDRYLALCMPFKHRIFSKRSRVKRLVVGLSVLALVFSVPRFFEVGTVVECSPGGGAEMGNRGNSSTNGTAQEGPNWTQHCEAYVQRTGLPENQIYRTIYHILLGSAFVTILPGVLTFVLTLRISIALGEAQRRRKRLSHCDNALISVGSTSRGTTAERESNPPTMDSFVSEKQQHKTVLLSGHIAAGSERPRKPSLKRKEHKANVMLVVVIVKFLISDILPTVLDVFETFIGNEAFMASPIATLWVDLSNFLLVINCSTNFWVFLLYVRGFRQRCARLLAVSLRLSPSSPQFEEASVYGGSCVASPRPSTPHFSVNGMTTSGGTGRSRNSAGEYMDLAKNAMVSSGGANGHEASSSSIIASKKEAANQPILAEQMPYGQSIRSKRASSLAMGGQHHNRTLNNKLPAPLLANGRSQLPMSNIAYRMANGETSRKKGSLGGW